MLVMIQMQARELHCDKMKKKHSYSILVFLFLFGMVFHEYEGAKATGRGSITKETRKELTQKDHNHRLLVNTDNHRKLPKAPSSKSAPVKSIISSFSRDKKNAQKIHGQRTRTQPTSTKLKPNQHVAGIKQKKGQSNESLLCLIIALIKLLFGINISSDICSSSSNQVSSTSSTQKIATISQQSSSTINDSPTNTTQQLTTTQQSSTLNMSSTSTITQSSTNTFPTSITQSHTSNAQLHTTTSQQSSPTNILPRSTTKQTITSQLSSAINTSSTSTTQQATTSQQLNTTNISPTSTIQSNSNTQQITSQLSSTTNTLPSSTAQHTTTQPSNQHIVTFFTREGDQLELTCQRVPNTTIKIIDATFGTVDSTSCPPTTVTTYMSKYGDGKTSLFIGVPSGHLFGDICSKSYATMNGTYACIPSNTPGTMVVDAFGGTDGFNISCPGGIIVMDSAMFGVFYDDVVCRKSIMGYDPFNAATSGVTSLYLKVSDIPTFSTPRDLCGNKLSITYRCQAATASSTLKSFATDYYQIPWVLVCPQGEINVTSVIFHSLNPEFMGSSLTDLTDVIRPLVPPNTMEAHLVIFVYQLLRNTHFVRMNASYTCADTVSSSPFTIIAQEWTDMVLKCPYIGQKIHLVSSKFYCATNPTNRVHVNPAGVVKKCEGKEGCSFYVNQFNVLDIPLNITIQDETAFPDCLNIIATMSGSNIRPVMLSTTYTCTSA